MSTSASSLLAALKAAKAKLGTSRDRAEKVPSGSSRWRILPRWDATPGEPGHPFGLHYVKNGAGSAVEAVYLCTSHTYGKPCEVCDEVARTKAIAISHGDTALQKVLEDAASQKKILVNALRHQPDGSYNGPVVLAMPVRAYDDYLGLVVGYLEEHGIDMLSLDQGLDITINRTGSGLSTRYQVQPVPRATVIPASVMDSVTNLDDYVNQEYESGLHKILGALRALTGGPAVSSSAALPASVASVERVIDATPARIGNGASNGSSSPASVSPATVKPVVIEAQPLKTVSPGGLDDLDLDDIDLDGIRNVVNQV